MTRLAAAPLLLVTMLLPGGAWGFAPIRVTVAGDGVARSRWPVTISVPFAPGELRPGGAVRVVDERGEAQPTQTRPLAHWRDGSIRWLLADSQVAVHAARPHELKVVLGRAPDERHPLRVRDGADAVRIDTGVLRFAIPKRRFAILERVEVGLSNATVIGPVNATLVADERVAEAGAPRRVTVTENGPLRARIALEGTYGNGFDYLIRVEAYAGQPFVRVWHTFIDRSKALYSQVARISVHVPLGRPLPAHYRHGTAAGPEASGRLATGVRLVQLDNATHMVGGESAEGRLPGWIELRGERHAVGLAARWFWQEYPQSIAAQTGTLTYNLWAPEAAPAKVGVGAAKTHELVLWAASAASDPAVLASAVRPSLAVVDPARVAASGALGMAVNPRADGAFVNKAVSAAGRYFERNARDEWRDCAAVRCDEDDGVRRVGAYGMWNWGDWNFRGYLDTTKGTDSWGNLEYDTPLVLALTYAATGDRAVYEQMVAAARHFIDVDTIHAFPERPSWVGMNHPKNPLHFSFELGGPDLGHTWTEGELAYYFLTGDDRGLAAARGIADYLVDRAKGFVRGNPRQWGWPVIALLAVYDATGDERYRAAALRYGRGGMRAHPPGGSDHWKLGILADALASLHAVEPDPDVRTWLEQYAAGVMRADAERDVRVVPAVAYVGVLTGDRAMLAEAGKALHGLDLGNWGKPFTINGRLGFRIASLLAVPAERSRPVPARPRHVQPRKAAVTPAR